MGECYVSTKENYEATIERWRKYLTKFEKCCIKIEYEMCTI